MKKESAEWRTAFHFLQALNETGYKSYIIGGAVRNHLLDKPVHDFDIVTEASSVEIRELFPQAVVPSRNFSTFIISWKDHIFEVTPFRSDTKRLAEDLVRRDFTMNACALDQTGTLIDPFDGIKDIYRRIIRSYDPTERMKEDPLRILRALRFVSELGFSIDEKTWQSLLSFKSCLRLVPVERILAEVEKLLKGRYHASALELLCVNAFLQHLPEDPPAKCAAAHRYNLTYLISVEERWAAFFIILYEEQAKTFIKSWRLPKKMQKTILFILDTCFTYPDGITWTNDMVYRSGKDQALQAERVNQWKAGEQSGERLETITRIYHALPITSIRELKVDGRDIIAHYPDIKREQIGCQLRFLEQAVLDYRVSNSKKELLSFLKEKLSNER